MKAKVYQVSISGTTYLVEARTLAGAIRDVVDEIAKGLRQSAVADIATGEQIYEAGKAGDGIINSGKYKRVVDPNQMTLPCVSEISSE